MTDPKGCVQHDCQECKTANQRAEAIKMSYSALLAHTYDKLLARDAEIERLNEKCDALTVRLNAVYTQEPVAWMHPSRDPHLLSHSAYTYGSASIPLFTAPVAQEPVESAKTRVEECRGYALLGTGQYCINHTIDFHPELGAELIITLATDEDKSGNRQVGEARDNPEPGRPIQPEEIVIRIGFLSERGLFALEDQLAWIRRLHFTEAAPVAQPAEHTGCACRWDADDNRVATCTRHQGWLDVVSEWADRAKDAEAKLAAKGKQ